MKPEQMFQAAEKYKSHLVEHFDAKPVRDTEGKSSANHLAWMCGQIVVWSHRIRHDNATPLNPIELTEHHDRIQKAMRWLGFVQGALWLIGDYTIEEFKSDNKDPEEVSSEEG